MTLTDRSWRRNKSYSQWVRDALARARMNGAAVSTLFDSSVPEPREMLRELIAGAVEPEFSRYFTSAFGDGNPHVLAMLAESYGVDAAQILCTSGATTGLSLVYRTLARPGDHILVETPGFDLFGDLAASQGLETETFERSGDRFDIDLDTIEPLIRPNTRLIVISNLHNPSGMALAQDKMVALAALAERYGIFVLVDEVYGDYASAEVRPCAAANISPHMISVSSLTKIYGLAVLRCGWIVGNPDIMREIRALSARVEFSVSSLSHALSAHVLAQRHMFDGYSADAVAKTRPIFERWAADMQREGLIGGELPQFGCICFPSLPGIDDSEAFSEWLGDTSGVLVAPGECFGAPGHIRIGFAQPVETIGRSLDTLGEGLRAFGRARQQGTVLRSSR